MNTKEPILLKTQVHFDERGSLRPIKLPPSNWEQINVVETQCGCVRGLHWQESPWDQAKLIVVQFGIIRDVVIDLITGEKLTYDMGPGDALWVPKNYAHGFCTLSFDGSMVSYLVDNKYEPTAERGVTPLCEDLKIDWGIPNPKANRRDLARPKWSERFESSKGLQKVC